ncbi:MAG TPA: NUDIX domain-containing protein [Candidatus Limnocylindria bacterium]|nr:NUDIX domain-containing protein [Candidatus Limnocylindria bacterium]
MPISDYLRALRAKVGTDLLLMPSVTAAIRDQGGRLLMALHADRRTWVLPGGCIDPGETPADALVREVWEETALHVEPVKLLGVFSGPEYRVHYANGDEAIYVMSVFSCRVLGGTPAPDGTETLDVQYLSAEEIAGRPTPVWFGALLPMLLGREERGFTPPSWRPPR